MNWVNSIRRNLAPSHSKALTTMMNFTNWVETELRNKPSCPLIIFIFKFIPKNVFRRYFPLINGLKNGSLKVWVDSSVYQKEMGMKSFWIKTWRVLVSELLKNYITVSSLFLGKSPFSLMVVIWDGISIMNYLPPPFLILRQKLLSID